MKKLVVFLGGVSVLLLGMQRAETQITQRATTTAADSVILLSGAPLDSLWAIEQSRLTEQLSSGQSDYSKLFTIQLFSGSRSEASLWYGKLRDSTSSKEVFLHYDEPNFKVSTGLYAFRLHAEYDLEAWRQNFPNAFVVKAVNLQPTK